ARSVTDEATPEDSATSDEARSVTDEATPEDSATTDEARSVTDEATPEDSATSDEAQSVTNEATPEDSEETDALPVAVLQSDAIYQDGTYTGSGQGFGGAVTVEVTITDGKISSVVSPSHEGETFWASMNVDSLLTTIVNANSADVDGVSGATRSSDGVKEAVRDALSKASESAFASGTGTARNPYVIETAGQLAAFAASVDGGTTYEGEYIVLGADIALSGDWNPIGDEGSYTSDQSKLFNGSFDGQGHTIDGVSVNISRDDEINAGLFSALNTAARVSNVKLTDVRVTLVSTADGKRVRGGGIAGATVSDTQSRAAVIDSCSVEGAVSVTTNAAMGYAAGVVGQLNGGGAVLNCVSQVSATGAGTGTAGRPYVGGIAANNGNNSVIANCVASGTIASNGEEADGYAGGLGGMLTGTVENCYFMGAVTLKGSATANAGTLVGMILTDSSMLYYQSDATLTVGGESVSEQPFGNNMGGASAVAMTRAEMSAAAFAETLNGNLYKTYKAIDDKELPLHQWEYVDGKVTPTGEVWVNETVDETVFAGGEGTQAAPWTLETAEQLRAFALSLSEGVDYDGAFIQLGADIDLSGETWTPVGEGQYAFEGTFDGAGHSVTGLTVGAAETPLNLSDNRYVGLFGVLGSSARVKNVALRDVEINVTADATAYVGGVAGMIYKTSDAEDFSGAVIDGVSVTGSITAAQQDGNCFVGGIAGYQQRGAVINSWTDVAISDTTLGEAIAEGGGLVGLLNRGLVANCYALGDVYVSGNREDGKEGMGAPGGLVSVNGGSLAGSYSKGNLTSKELSFYAGTVAGWVTGIGKAYDCFYNGESVVTVNGSAVTPVPATGTVVPGGVSEDGLSYNGGVTDKLEPYTASTYAAIAETLNGYFSAYPVDLAAFGLESDALKTWIVKDSVVTLSESGAAVTYVQPEAEIVPDTPLALRDGVWYGRDENKSSVVKITVADSAISATETVSGASSGDAYDAALESAKEKSAYGDFTHYEPADPSKFAGGSGTESDPYLISNAEQLRYLSSSVNEDVTWKGVWFRQTADIDLSGADFIPIGWAKEINVNNAWENVGYFFEGSYDGGGHSISGLTIGSESAPADYMAAGLFGLTNGEYVTNDEPTAEQNAVALRNINLKDVAVYISCGDQTYAGGLVGMGQNGILIDDCSVTGTVHASTTDSHCRAGGLAASLLRGRVTDSWTDVDVYGVTEKGRVYASGLCVTNRVSVLNCYTLGNTSGKADQYNRVWAGGVDAFAGGLKINCYSFGDVIAESGATGVGGVNGLAGGVSATYLSYFNADAAQSSAGTKAETNVSTGDNFANATDESQSKTAAEIKSGDFVTLLNENRAGLLAKLNEVKADLGYPTYFDGAVSNFREWALSDNAAPKLQEGKPDENPDEPAPDTPDVFEYENAPLTFQSARNYGGAATDAFHDVAYTSDGGFVVMGYSFGESSDPAWTHTGSGNNNDAVLLKFDSDYKLQWSKAYGGDGVDVFNAIDVLNDGRIAAIGRSSFTSADESIKNVSWYLLLIDPANPDNYTDYRIGGTAGDQGYDVAATSDGGFVAAGWSASKSGFVTSSSDRENYSAPVQLWEAQDGTNDAIPNRIAGSGSDSVIVKFDSAGNVQYAVLHNYSVSENANNISSPSERLDSIALDSADNIYLVGYNAVAQNAQNAVIAKLNGANGALLWHRSAGRQDQTTVPENAAEYIKAEYSGVAVLKDNSVVVTGTSTGDATTEEGWKITGVKDTLVTRYSADGKFLFSDSFGTIDDNNSRPEGILATPDGGYIVYGSQAGVMQEDALVEKGYDWGNYGGQDAILVKYGADNALAWAENYGSNMGDWINGMAIRPNGEMIAVGESNGQNGVPAWGNNGGLDGVILCAGVLPDAYAGTGAAVSDGNVTWADSSYTATGNGFGGADSVEVTVVIEGGKIASVDGENKNDSAAYYTAATDLHDTIVERQSADVDGVTGATYSSNGIKEAASKALGKSAAAYVDALIDAIETASDKAAATKSAADAYAELGTYSVSQLKNLTALQSAARQYGLTLVSRADGGGSIAETKPQSGAGLRHNDAYYKLQNAYYKNIHAEAFEDANLNGEGVKIAVIDSGLNPSHQDLDYSRVLEGYDYDNGVVMGRDSLTDNNGHGTAVTGILAAVADNEIGVAGLFSKLQVIPLKVSPVSPAKDTDGASSKLVAQAITDAVDKYQADVITTSLDVKDTEELARAVAYAASKGVIITGASGNSSKEENNGNDPYIYPASYDEVISVGAVDANNQIRANSQKNDKVFVAAPGENIAVLDLSMSGRCKLASGTSYASPMVAAMAVAAKQYDKNITVSRFKTLLQTSSASAGLPGYDTSYGYGVVDFEAFVGALKDTSENSGKGYVLMNIPYADFYAAELNANAAAVDAVTSATLNKPRTGTLAGGSYHVNSDGSDISGVIYPVFVPDMSALDGKTQITDSSSVSITVTNRGTETTTEYAGREALFESASYSYYVLDETPAYYKELTVSADGAFTFGAVSGRAASVEGVTGSVTVGGRHADIEIALTIPENGGITQGATVSGVILTDSDGAKYGLRHVVNIWRGTELGWNLGELDLNGKTITNIRYITQSAVYDYPVELAIGNPGYVLMNIPYAEFYAAELGDGGAVDAVTTATLKFENKSMAAGSYHVNDSATDEESDLTGATYPVFVPDMSALDATLEVKATDKKTFNLVTGREKTVTATEVEGSDILFCAPSYSWFRLTEKPARYKALSVDENGAFTFGAVSGRAATVNDVSVRISYETHHGNDAEIVLTGTGIESGAIVGGVVLTDSDGVKYGLPHVQGIWSRTQLGWPNTSAIAGKTFTNARFILRDSVIDCPLEFTVKPKMAGALSATFTGARELTLGGLAGDIANAKVTVTYTTGERPNTETHTVADGVAIVGGKVTLTVDAISGQSYTVKVESDNYGDKSASVQATDAPDTPDAPDNPATPDTPSTPANQGGCYVATAVYGSYDCPEVWTLRRFRDNVLAETWYGRLFIRLYYAVSPTAVKLFGDAQWFQDFFRARLDTLVSGLQDDGFESTPYEDTVW
ncbi:MAG: S8 family serine peptidase, partial [Oscillibacter sp.]|nr:S8 family serine peptidase [Oscillibacter sp.]